MAQLDRLISVMVSNKADAITIMEDDVAKMVTGGEPKPMTKSPVNAAQFLGLIKEIAPAEAVKSLNAGAPATFRHENPDGVFVVRVRNDGAKWMAHIRVDDDGEFQRLTGAFKAISEADVKSHTPQSAPAVVPAPKAAIAVTDERSAAAKAGIDELLKLLVAQGGSDLHLRVDEPPILRLHGEMHRLDDRPILTNDWLTAMVQTIMPQRNKDEFAETNDTDYAYEIEGVARFRANAARDRKGVAAVFRVIPANVVSVEQLGISQEVQNLCYLTKGLVLVTGPTGSGKSTTLCSLIDLVNRSRNDHIITIEDPIEFVHPNKNCILTQRQVGVHTQSFKSALRAALREDPDVILVGELRDLETTSIAIETAETGHLVFGTLHTTTAASTIDRIIDQFPADRQDQVRTMLSESLKGVIAQVLCKKIGGGRVAVREIMISTPALSNLIREGKTFQIPSMIQTSKKFGMITMNDALIQLVNEKVVEPKEAYMKSVEKTGFLALLKNNGHDTSFAEADAPDEKGAKSPAGAGAAGAQRPMAGRR
jgi:twitching motility protein PilT